ncbi:AAA family ATPase [Terricaulis sp.]|uniref:AAA family ATPase n=1 Tax=Terricaulis sp. TaxID=2768686 RepID=UPI0037852170
MNDNADFSGQPSWAAEDEFSAPDEFVVEAPAPFASTCMMAVAEEDHAPALAPETRTRLAVALADVAPDFDSPDAEPEAAGCETVDEEPPFDPPDVNTLTVGAIMFESDDLARLDDVAAVEAARRRPLTASEDVAQSLPPLLRPREASPEASPLPPIAVHISWDRPESAESTERASKDEHIARATVTASRGGIDGAALYFQSHPAPDLLILDTTLRGHDMVAALDRLIAVIGKATKLIVIGSVNDVALLRELTARGVCEYLVAPVGCGDLVAAACRLFEDTDKARVIAVIGARGGVGASTLALNLAWSIAERQQSSASLLDLDLSFGTAAFTFHQEPQATETELQRVLTQHTSRLEVMAAPARLEHELAIETLIEAELKRARRASAYVILDLPHAWTGWVRRVLSAADEVVLVAAPDLANLASAKAIVEALKAERAPEFNPIVALSMAGMAKRPQIEAREFAAALGAAPAAILPFDANLFGMAAINAQMIGEAAPRSKAALAIDVLASAVTGRQPICDNQKPEPRMVSPEQGPIAAAPPREESPEATPLCGDASAPETPLELTQKLPAILESPYLTRARATAKVRHAPAKEKPTKSDDELQRPGRVARMAACSIGILVLGGVWFANRDSGRAAAGQPSTSAPIAATTPALTPPQPVTPLPQPAAPATEAAAQYELAAQLLDGGRREEGIEQLRRAAAAGYAPAQYRFAKAYEHGDGLDADLALARQWCERAAAGGNVRAMHDLGVYFARGDGGRRDEAAAFRWFRQAAEFGVSDSQYNLGILYQQGRGVSRNAGEALFWYLVASRQGDGQSARRAAALERELTPIQVEQARARAQAFSPRAPSEIANAPPPLAEEPAPEAAAATAAPR